VTSISSCVFIEVPVAIKLTLTDPPWARCTPQQTTLWWCSLCSAGVSFVWGYLEAGTVLRRGLQCGEMVRRWQWAWRLSKCEGAVLDDEVAPHG
jgi:hypothetical protein